MDNLETTYERIVKFAYHFGCLPFSWNRNGFVEMSVRKVRVRRCIWLASVAVSFITTLTHVSLQIQSAANGEMSNRFTNLRRLQIFISLMALVCQLNTVWKHHELKEGTTQTFTRFRVVERHGFLPDLPEQAKQVRLLMLFTAVVVGTAPAICLILAVVEYDSNFMHRRLPRLYEFQPPGSRANWHPATAIICGIFEYFVMAQQMCCVLYYGCALVTASILFIKTIQVLK